MDCAYFDAGVCRSCALLGIPYATQLAAKEERARALVAVEDWLPAIASPPAGFRTKAKMVVAGTVSAPTLGILAADGSGVDLRECLLYPPAISLSLGPLAQFVTRANLEPYDVPERTGELKHILVTASAAGQLMVRFVMRSTEALSRIKKHLPWLHEQLPLLKVVSLNVLAHHQALLEGEREIVLSEAEALTMLTNGVPLHLKPQSFFQTNEPVAAALYRQVAEWVNRVAPAAVWDLYCGVGGFALHCLASGRKLIGVETSVQAVESAQLSAAQMAAAGVPGADLAVFIAGDATTFPQLGEVHGMPELVIVNPPRRGIGPLASWLQDSGIRWVIYSSCNMDSLAKDLSQMPSYKAVEGQVLDMFPHTEHCEVAVLLERQEAPVN